MKLSQRHNEPLLPAQSRDRCRGFTIVELLVASTIALSVMAAVATLFATFGNAGASSQSLVDMSNRMRQAANRLRQDLAGVSVTMRPPISPETNSGYFELIEGARVDLDASGANLIGDWDDVLLFTTQSQSAPFQGRFLVTGTGPDNRIESNTAEVAWFCRQSTIDSAPGLTLYTLYRRQLLVMGYVGAAPFHQSGSGTSNQLATATVPAAFSSYDISLRNEGAGVVPNTLADLAQRENRFLHGPAWNTPFSPLATGAVFDTASRREGEDIVLTNVLSFDVRVFDPQASVRTKSGFVLLPGDGDYVSASGTATTRGAFLDLGRVNAGTVLSGSASAKAGGLVATYDTWSTAYETDGNGTDQGADGLDSLGAIGDLPDDAGETETSPPYPVSLRAVEVRIRCYDPTSRQVRQTTIRQAFFN